MMSERHWCPHIKHQVWITLRAGCPDIHIRQKGRGRVETAIGTISLNYFIILFSWIFFFNLRESHLFSGNINQSVFSVLATQIKIIYNFLWSKIKTYISDWSSNWPTGLYNFLLVILPINRQLNLLSTATPAIGAWLVPIDQLKSSIRKWDMEGTLRVCAVMGCIMTEALEVSATFIRYHLKCPK